MKNKSGYVGVSWHKSKNKWQAQKKHEGKMVYLGYYDTPQEAANAVAEFTQKGVTLRTIAETKRQREASEEAEQWSFLYMPVMGQPTKR